MRLKRIKFDKAIELFIIKENNLIQLNLFKFN